MRIALQIALRAAALALVLLTPEIARTTDARGVSVNLEASWPSSPLFPLFETSEYLADENPAFFWQFVDRLRPQTAAIAAATQHTTDTDDNAVDTLAALAVNEALHVAPDAKNLLELTLATRTYSVKVEMHRQLGLDSGVRACNSTTDTWAVVYREPHCVDAVACTASDLAAALATDANTNATCVATSVHDVALANDHVFVTAAIATQTQKTVLLYGALGTQAFYAFHDVLARQAEAGDVQYIVRHFAMDSDRPTRLQGFGVALDIKNMEYKTIDDSSFKASDALEGENDDDDDEENDDDDEEEDDVDGLLFQTLVRRHRPLAATLRHFRTLLLQHNKRSSDSIDKPDANDAIKAWHLQDVGFAAAREVVEAAAPLQRLETLAQDFPKHAKRLAIAVAKRPLAPAIRTASDQLRAAAIASDVLNKLFVNGIAVDPTQRSFNIFDFMATLKAEWSIAKRLDALPLSANERATMLENVRATQRSDAVVRIHVRGSPTGTAPFYLNDIATDPKTAQWPTDVDALRRPAWNVVFLRTNMYECVVAFDPLATSAGRSVLQQIAFLQMRGAPLQWGLLVSSADLLAAPTRAVRQAVVATYKTAGRADKATAWHFAKLLFLARAQDVAQASRDGASGFGSGRVVASYLEGVADESVVHVTLQHLVTSFVDATFGLKPRKELESEAVATLTSELYDDDVLSMTEWIERKHLPLESSLFNGVLRSDIDIQADLMGSIGRDQALYQDLARRDLLSNEDGADLIEELLAAQETYPSYFTLFDAGASSRQTRPTHLLAHDADATIELLIETHVDYVHAPQSLLLPKKQTLLIAADVSDPVHAAHVLESVKAVLEDSNKALRLGLVPRLGGSSDDKETTAMQELVASIWTAVGTTDNAAHLRFVLDALRCVVRGKSVAATRTKLRSLLDDRNDAANDDDPVVATLQRIVDGNDSDSHNVLSPAKRAGLARLQTILHQRLPRSSSTRAQLFINGYPIELPTSALTAADVAALTAFDATYRSVAVAKAFVKKTPPLHTIEEANAVSLLVVKVCDLVDRYTQTDRTPSLEVAAVGDAAEALVVRLPGDAALHVAAYLDPLSEATQMISSLLLMLHRQLNASVEIVLLPTADHAEFPLQRFYRYVFDTKATTLTKPTAAFRKLPIAPILTMKIETPEAWNVQVHATTEDLDNLRVDASSASDVRATKTATFQLESLLVYGQCRDKTLELYTPPHGLQLVLERDVGATTRLHRDTLVMRNFGYFQLQATPGVWSLHLARGRATELFEIVDLTTDAALPTTPMVVSDFGSHLAQLVVRKRKGREHDELLDPAALQTTTANEEGTTVEPIAADAGLLSPSYWGSMVSSLLGKKKPMPATYNPVVDDAASNTVNDTGASSSAMTAPVVVNRGRSGETIHVFSLASGHLYERFLKIMMSSVLKRTTNPVTFWLLENFLSPAFKQSIPALRSAFGMDIRLVTYKWPNWLRQQTQKQRVIWGYKILFLDVLFPLGVQKIIYVDADQVVRADLLELWTMDLDGAPYGYTPFCSDRNVGFQFWRQGYWKDHLRGRPYHISALYVVDLALFRQMAAGDALRATYDQLSADPHSLSNLDQDLPNYTQHQIKIFSLPQEWLWCDSWCSDASKGHAKTIDLCNNPKHKEPKLDMAKRVISGDLFNESWIELDQEIKDAESAFIATAEK